MMVSLGVSGNQEYVISMDDIDLRMLPPFNHQRRYETVSRCPGAEYFEFEVIDGVGGEDAGRGHQKCKNSKKNIRVQRCHVCAVDVPVTYLEEHRRSDGHRACCSITDVALDRAKKQISLDNSLSSASRSSTSYCLWCSCAVDLTNQNDHEKSLEHSRSVLHIKLIQSLATLYQNKNNLDKVCRDLLQVFNKDATKIVGNDIESKDAREHKIDEISNKDKTVRQIDSEIDEEVSSLESLIPTENKDESSQKDDVIIITETKAKLRVSFDNYQGFVAVRGYTQCRVCQKLIHDKTQHLLDEKHKMKVEAVVKDKHCIRQLDHLCNHCILCNEIIGSPEAHILCSPHHKDFLEKALIEDSVTEILNNPAEYFIKSDDASEKYFCDACEIYIKKTTLLDHVKSDAHKGYCSLCDTYLESGPKSRKAHFASKAHRYKLWLTEKNTKIHYHMRKSAFENVVVCCVCDIQLNNNIGEIREHVNSIKHQLNREIMLKNNYMENVNDCSVFCLICNETEYVIDEIQHTKTKPHLNKLRNFTSLKIEPEELKQITQSHENAKLKEILQINRIEIYDVSYYQCKVCFQCFKKTEVFNHVFSKNHNRCRDGCSEDAKEAAGIVETVRENSGDQVDETKTEVISHKQSVNKKEINYVKVLKMNQIDDKLNTFYRCNVCDRLIAKSIDIQIHISTKKHKEKLDQFIRSQNVNPKTNNAQTVPLKFETTNISDVAHSEPVNSSNNYKCEEEIACKLKANWIEKRLTKNYCTYYYCIACEAAIENGLEETHILLETHQSNISKLNRLLAHGVSKNGLNYFCTLCYESIELGFEETHLLSENHKLLFDENEDLKIKKGLPIISSNYFCDICSETIPLELEHKNEHVESEPHKANIQMSTFKTDIINVPDNLNTNIKKEKAYEPVGSIMERSKLKRVKKLHYLFKENHADGQVRCLVCNINMSLDEVLAHRKDKNHHEMYAKVMDSNTMFRIKHRCFCECCREILKVDCEYIHLTSERHRLNLIINTERMDEESLHKLSLNMFHQDIAEEKKAKRHEKYAKLPTTRFADGSGDGGDYRFENHKTCLFLSSSNDLRSGADEEDDSASDSNDGFMSARTSITSEETPDMIPENKYTESVVSEEPEEGDDKLETAAAEFTKSISYLFKDTNNPLELLCKLCHCVVANRSDMILEHIVGVKHAKKYESILLVNELKETIDKRKETIQKYRCQACGLDVEKIELFAHINGSKHKLYLTAKPSTSGNFQQTGVEKDVKVEPPIRIGQEINDKHIIELLFNSEHKHNFIFQKCNGSDEMYCKLCDSEFSVTDLNNHINSRTHQMSFDFYLLENEIKKVGVTFFCDLCKIGLAEGTELDHLYGDKHKDNITKYSLSTSKIVNITVKSNAQKTKKVDSHVCTACNVEMLNIPKIIKTHYISVRHKTNVEKSKTGRQISKDSNGTAQSSEYLCKVCSVKLPNNPNNIKMHNEGARHISKLKESKPSVALPLLKLTESKPTVAIPLRKLTESAPTAASPSPETNSLPKPISSTNIPTANIAKPAILNYVENGFCHVCKTNVENKIECIREHLKGKTHNETLNSLKSKLNENNAHIPKQIQSYSSQNVVSKPEISYSYVTNGFCRACKMNVPNNIGNIEEHIKEKYHTQKVNIIESNKSANNKVLISNQNVDSVTGPIQNNVLTVPLGNKREQINENLLSIADGSATRKRTRRRKKDYISTSQNNAGEDTEATLNNNIIMSSSDTPKVADFVLSNLEKTESTDPRTLMLPKNNTTPNNNNNHIQPKVDSKNCYFCKICKLQVPNHQNNIQEHMKGTRHKSNVTILIQMPPPAKVEAQVVYECLICDVNVTNNTNNIAEHFKGKKHKLNVKNLISSNEISVVKLSDINQDNNSNVEKKINDDLVGAKTLRVDSADIKTIISQPSDHSAISGSRIFDNNTVDVSDVKVNNNKDNLSNTAAASTSKLTLDNVISMCCWLSSHSNPVTSISDKSNESGKTESINSTIPKINICSTQRGTSDGTTGATIFCTSKAEDCIDTSALKCEDTKPGICQLYDSSKIDIKTNPGNAVETEIAGNKTHTNLVSPSCDNSNENEYAENISTKIAAINTDVTNASSEMQIFKSTELDTSKSIASIPMTSKHDETNRKNITLDGSTMDTNIFDFPKTEESSTDTLTDTDTAGVVEADDVTSDFVIVTAKDDSYEINDDSDAKTEPNLGFYVCSVCERPVPNNQTDIKSHLRSYHHQSKLSEKKEKEQEGLLSNSEEYCCDFCNEKMSYNSIAINNHDNTLGHRNRFKKALLQNKIKMRDDKVCYCEACDLYFSKFTVKTHISREKHCWNFLSSFDN